MGVGMKGGDALRGGYFAGGGCLCNFGEEHDILWAAPGFSKIN